MVKLRLGLELVTSKAEIKRLILKECEVVINKAALISEFKSKPEIIPLIRQALLNAPEVKELLGGSLQSELGVRTQDASNAILKILDEVINSVELKVRFSNASLGKINLVITLKVFPYVLVNKIINDGYGVYQTSKGVDIPWLEWLLTLGDQPIVKDYMLRVEPTYSRTGYFIMKKATGRAWRVPPQFSGTKTNNFITRALDSIADKAFDIVIDNFTNNVQ